MKKVIRLILILLLSAVILIVLLPGGLIYIPRGHGKQFKSDFTNGFSEADKVRVIIHSHKSDFILTDGDNVKAKIHQEIELTNEQRLDFLNDIEEISSRENDSFFGMPKCGFDPHHTFVFEQRGEVFSEISVCFRCSSAGYSQNEGNHWLGAEYIEKKLHEYYIETAMDWQTLANGNGWLEKLRNRNAKSH